MWRTAINRFILALSFSSRTARSNISHASLPIMAHRRRFIIAIKCFPLPLPRLPAIYLPTRDRPCRRVQFPPRPALLRIEFLLRLLASLVNRNILLHRVFLSFIPSSMIRVNFSQTSG